MPVAPRDCCGESCNCSCIGGCPNNIGLGILVVERVTTRSCWSPFRAKVGRTRSLEETGDKQMPTAGISTYPTQGVQKRSHHGAVTVPPHSRCGLHYQKFSWRRTANLSELDTAQHSSSPHRVENFSQTGSIDIGRLDDGHQKLDSTSSTSNIVPSVELHPRPCGSYIHAQARAETLSPAATVAAVAQCIAVC